MRRLWPRSLRREKPVKPHVIEQCWNCKHVFNVEQTAQFEVHLNSCPMCGVFFQHPKTAVIVK